MNQEKTEWAIYLNKKKMAEWVGVIQRYKIAERMQQKL